MEQKFIPLSVPNLKGNELKYITQAVETEWVSTGGPYVNDFEKAIADYVKVPLAVSCQNGTAGLHIALILAGVKAGDEVLSPTLTFIAAVNPIKYIGAEPVFMDCDDSLCMDPHKLETFCRDECTFENGILRNKKSNRIIKALIVVHVFGNMADMEALLAIASQYDLKVVEDATEALGTYYTSGPYQGKYAGTMGDFGVYSFNGNKIITTGGGGMIVARKEVDSARAKHITTQAKSDVVNFIHDEIGYNYRMTNLQAALGLAQLEQLEDFIATKKANYNRYASKIDSISGLSFLGFKVGTRTNYWFYSVFFYDFPLNRAEVIERLQENKIQARPIWGLIHEQIPYKEAQSYKIEKAKFFWDRILNVPCSTNLSADDVDCVCSCIKEMRGVC